VNSVSYWLNILPTYRYLLKIATRFVDVSPVTTCLGPKLMAGLDIVKHSLTENPSSREDFCKTKRHKPEILTIEWIFAKYAESTQNPYKRED
jgi:hypothetical protein